MVMPAIHLSRTQVADTFTKETGRPDCEDITSPQASVAHASCAAVQPADMGISGMNFAAELAPSQGLVTNEGQRPHITRCPACMSRWVASTS